MKTRCLLVDDEPLAIQLLQNHLSQLESFEVVATTGNAIRALEILQTEKIDLLFCDIKMPRLTGIDLLKTLKNPPKTILTTAYREYALDGYDLDVVDYLLKPITFERFFRAIDRYLRTHQPAMAAGPVAAVEAEPVMWSFKSGNKVFRLTLNDVFYIESQKDYVRVVTTSNQPILTKASISDLETELADKCFLRVHRSFLVNLNHVAAYSATELDVGPYPVPIGANYRELVMSRLRA
jgi:two-component system, LytTR family, response regulator